MCLKPKWIYKKGNYKESNYRGEKGAFYELGTYTKCGVCSECIAEKCNNWVVRNAYEEKDHVKKCFITLTYKEQPFFLVRKDFQDFMKRFRFEINKEYYKKLNNVKKGLSGEELKLWKEDHKEEFIKTKIYYCGEYGTKHGRCHFHAIIYGWEDENPRYLGVNKKSNIIYQSTIIQKTWGLGRTSYQKFGEHEAPYMSLYSTPQEEFKKSYKMTMEKAKKIRKLIYGRKGEITPQYQNLLLELEKITKKLEEEKEKYYLIKEFNGWSTALGWKNFERQYDQQRHYVFEEYVGGSAKYATPSPWVKKLANMGDIQAAKEMFRREAIIVQSKNEEEEMLKNLAKEQEKRKKELIEWQERGRKNGETSDF